MNYRGRESALLCGCEFPFACAERVRQTPECSRGGGLRGAGEHEKGLRLPCGEVERKKGSGRDPRISARRPQALGLGDRAARPGPGWGSWL